MFLVFKTAVTGLTIQVLYLLIIGFKHRRMASCTCTSDFTVGTEENSKSIYVVW